MPRSRLKPATVNIDFNLFDAALLVYGPYATGDSFNIGDFGVTNNIISININKNSPTLNHNCFLGQGVIPVKELIKITKSNNDIVFSESNSYFSCNEEPFGTTS